MKSDPRTIHASLPVGASVLDVGCHGFTQRAIALDVGRTDLRHSGVDYSPPAVVPVDVTFATADLNVDALPFGDDTFDLVVASHVLEHVRDGVRLFGECLRVCKPGGIVVVETPSERSLWLPGFPFARDMFYSLSFYDDPTHLGRPWTAQALHRLSRYFGAEVIECRYLWTWKARLALPFLLPYALVFRRARLLEKVVWGAVGWSCRVMATKPPEQRGAPPFNYFIPPRP